MISFFRNFRQNLLTENKVTKYLLYTIGEIFLVVVGILIALQINNWNEARKERIKELEIYENLSVDIREDISTLKGRINLSKREMEALYDFVHNAYKTQKSTEEYLVLMRSVLWNADNFILQDKTFNEMISSGKLGLLSDKSLKNEILEYYKSYDIASTHIAELNQTSINMLGNASEYAIPMKYMGLSDLFDKDHMFSESDWEFINKPHSIPFRLLEQAAGYYFFKNRFFMDYFSKQDSLAKELARSIEMKLGEKK